MNEILDEAHHFCRLDSRYRIEIDLCGVYACKSVTGYFQGKPVITSMGDTIEKHIKVVLEGLKKHKNDL